MRHPSRSRGTGFFDPDMGLAAIALLTTILAKPKPRMPYIPSQETINRAHAEALREDWNRNVAAKKARK